MSACNCCEQPINSVPVLEKLQISQTCIKGPACGWIPPNFFSLPERDKCHTILFKVKTTVNNYFTGAIGTLIEGRDTIPDPVQYRQCVFSSSSTCTNTQNGGCVGPIASQSIQYSSPYPDDLVFCLPTQLPEFPEFENCPTLPQTSFFFAQNIPTYRYTCNPSSYIAVKWRVAHGPIATCYLKVWIITRTQTFAPNESYVYNWQDGACCPNFITQSITENVETYEWRGTPDLNNQLCIKNIDLSNCENIVYGNENILQAATGELKTINILKYSYIENYEPNDPDPINSSQGNKPNGFPIPV